jgi:anti-sigma factor RsiW
MSRHRIPYAKLIAFAAGDLTGADADRVRELLADDPHGAETVARFRMARETLQSDDGVEPPDGAVASAQAIFRTVRRPSLTERVVEAVGELIFDSRAVPALAGLRGQATAFQTTWRLSPQDGVDLDLQAELVDDEAAGGERWRLVGQVVSMEPAGSVGVELCRAGSTVPIQSIESDQRGAFLFHVESGSYDLYLELPHGLVVVPGIRLNDRDRE